MFTLTEETTMPAKKTTPAKAVPFTSSGHVTPRRIISMNDDLWQAVQELAALRHMNASALIRETVRDLIAEARAEGELPKRKRGAA